MTIRTTRFGVVWIFCFAFWTVHREITLELDSLATLLYPFYKLGILLRGVYAVAGVLDFAD
jgi:hypothetical protein